LDGADERSVFDGTLERTVKELLDDLVSRLPEGCLMGLMFVFFVVVNLILMAYCSNGGPDPMDQWNP
jgi:hypothetical protein